MRKGVSVTVRGLLDDDTGPANTTSLGPRGSPCGVCHGPVGAGCVRREEMGSDTCATTSSALAAPSPPLHHRLPVTMCPTFLHVQSLPRTSLCEWTVGSASCRRDMRPSEGGRVPAGRPSEGPSPPRQLPHLRNCFAWGLRWDGGSRGRGGLEGQSRHTAPSICELEPLPKRSVRVTAAFIPGVLRSLPTNKAQDGSSGNWEMASPRRVCVGDAQAGDGAAGTGARERRPQGRDASLSCSFASFREE